MSNGHFSADSPQKSVSSRRIVTVAVICVLALALAAVGFFLVRPALDPYHCRMADGVSIAGVDVGGMTKGEARKALQAALDETLYRENLTVALPMESITLSPADTGVQVDVRAAVNDAYRMGRSDGSLPGDMDLRPYLNISAPRWRAMPASLTQNSATPTTPSPATPPTSARKTTTPAPPARRWN